MRLLGASRRHLGASCGSLGGPLGASWGPPTGLGGLLGAEGWTRAFEFAACSFPDLFEHSGPFVAPLGPCWGSQWGLLVRLRAILWAL